MFENINKNKIRKAVKIITGKKCYVTKKGIFFYNSETMLPSEEEIQAKIIELEAEDTKKQIELRATNFVQKQLKDLDYENEGEVALYATNEDSSWHDEAIALQKWIEEVYKKMYELMDSVNMDNYKDIDLDKIEAEYPAFEFEGEE